MKYNLCIVPTVFKSSYDAGLVIVSILKLKYRDKTEISPLSHQDNCNLPRSLAIPNPAFFKEHRRPSLVHAALSFCPQRFWNISKVQVAPEIKASFKEQRSRRDPIKMVKIFRFYLGILVRTRVYTNTDCMSLRVGFFLSFFTFSVTFI